MPSTTCLWVMITYLTVGTIMFAEWEGWNYLDSVYFCVTSLTKIGFGDFVPGKYNLEGYDLTEVHSSSLSIQEIVQIKLVITFIYILLGMAVVAMCYYLLKEEVSIKFTNFKDKIIFKCKVCRNSMPKTSCACTCCCCCRR